MANYKHGTYSEFAASVGNVVTGGGTVPVYVGTAPVNLVRDYKQYVNSPVKLSSFGDVKRYMGYAADWNAFDLCEAFQVHFNNSAGNVGPIVAINVLNPDVHQMAEATSVDLTFVNGRATIKSATIILDTLDLGDLVEGTDYSVDYDYTKGLVIIDSLGDTKITGVVAATYIEVDASAITKDDIIGGVTAEGVYTGLGCIDLIYQEQNVVPDLILCPGWSEVPAVYEAMITAGTKINGHWDAMALADMPLVDGSAVDTIEKAIQWAKNKGYNNWRTKVFWPRAKDTSGRVYHGAVLCAWLMSSVDATHNGIPMESPSNLAVPVAAHYFGENSKNRGFDQQRANELNAAGITTVVFWGGQWVLWGPHTAAYLFGTDMDDRDIFDVNVRMLMHAANTFQLDHAGEIDRPMTRAMKDTILNLEQEKLDGWAAMGGFIGKPVVTFDTVDNTPADLVEGNFTWNIEGTPTPPFKSGTAKVAYTSAGLASYTEEVQ